MALATRIATVDFARGLVLVAMTIDHLPGNVLEHFTPRNFALSDSAEAFVFLSGLSVGLVTTAGLSPEGWRRWRVHASSAPAASMVCTF